MGLMKISLDKLFLVLVFLGTLIFVIRPIEDPDYWWHLKTGEYIVQQKQIPFVDDFSFSATGKPWIAHEWLSEVIMYGIFKVGGIPFTVIFFAVLILVSFAMTIFRTETRKNLYALGGALILGVILSTPVLWARPQIFTLVYTSLFLFLLDRFLKTVSLRYLIPLPIIMILWVNQHGAFIVGMGLIGIYLLGLLVDQVVKIINEKSGISKIFTKPIWILVSLLLICTLAILVNPNGWRMFLYPFQTVNDPSLQTFNQEWASPNFHERTWIPLAVMYLALIGFGLKSKKTVTTVNILLCMIFGYLALLALKQVALFALVSIPILADLIADVLPFSRSNMQSKKLVIPIALVSIAGLVLIGANALLHLREKQGEFIKQFYPVKAVEYIQKESIDGRIFNSYNWGGYMIWNLYPAQRVYIDGRCDMYGTDFVTRFVDIYSTKPGWENALKADEIEYVLVEPNTYLAYALVDHQGWKTIFRDNVSVLFQNVNQ